MGIIFIAGKRSSGAGQAGNAASELPALPPGKQGSLLKMHLSHININKH